MKISLKTLSKATPQQVFDQVATHLLKQGKKSLGTVGCRYHTSSGLMCAAGCLIDNDEYSAEIENKSWHSLSLTGLVPNDHRDLIIQLQDVHDGKDVYQWPAALSEVAAKFGLSRKVIS